jgi:PAS domain S-box-containing protein
MLIFQLLALAGGFVPERKKRKTSISKKRKNRTDANAHAKSLLIKEIESLSRFPAESPNAVMRISKDGNVLYSNKAGLLILDEWKSQVGQPVPLKWRQLIADVFKSETKKEFEEAYGAQTFLIMLAPIVDAGYVNIYGRDITERKKAEEKLHAGSLYSRSLIEASLDPLVTISAEGKITDVNKATEEVTGFSREQLISSDFSDYFTEPEEAQKGYRKVFTEGFVKDYPLAIRHKAGKVTDVLYNATVYRNEFGEMQGVFAAARDITERKRAQEALRKAHDELEMRVKERTRELTEATWKLQAEIAERKKREEELRETRTYLENMIDYANAPIIVWNPAYRITRFNHAFERLTGHKAEDVSDKPLEILFPEDSKEESLKHIRRTASGEYWQVVEIPILRTDGNVRTVLWNSANILGKDGTTVVATIAQGQDITERKIAEKALRESEIDLNRAQAVAKTGSWRLDVRRNELLWSDETYRMFGIPNGTPLTYETFLNAVHPDDREYVDKKWQAAMRGEPYDIEHRIIVNGKVKWVHEKTELEFDKDRMLLGGFGTVQEITEFKEMQDKLEEYSQHLEQLVEEKTQKLKETERLVTIGETAGMVGHDIRNPLQSIEGAVYLAKEELKSLPPDSPEKKELHGILEIIRRQTGYIDRIVADLQDFSGTPMVQFRETNLQELVTDALSMTEIPENIQVQTSIQDDLQTVTVDSVFMKRVLLNLIENAVHAMPNGGRLTIKAFKQDECACIHVEDTGVCIPEENKPRIFTPLFTTKAKGQGFGLAVCKKLVEAHRGEITFESEAGKGTTFKIKFPQRKEAV